MHPNQVNREYNHRNSEIAKFHKTADFTPFKASSADTGSENAPSLPYVPLKIGKIYISSLVDTGADISILHYNIFSKIPKEKIMNYSRIEKNDIQIKGVTGNKIQLEGRCNIEVFLGGQKAIIPIFIASNIQQKFILGYKDIN